MAPFYSAALYDKCGCKLEECISSLSMESSKKVTGVDGALYTLFFTTENCFSNFHPCEQLYIDGESFSCSEQYFMYRKAVTFGDDASARKILTASRPGEMKRLGREVTPFDVETWRTASIDAMITAVAHKFAQNESLREELLKTAGSTLVECNPRDPIWGIGLSMKNPAAADPKKWKGKNLLGRILTEVRDCMIDDTDADIQDVINAVKKSVNV
ncbi:hypothetical protein QR680_013634 [Steinernema hermaphroditum]|uniref:NADAR domain-containing protein n=1 Tax=Steinernema hermaphroditum TaxID=289476 RepID=A0AA39I8Y7_9BILA|nr:hypothetical protein QR680_013634 [Steinernema hermaphroditum]